jgi:hypothetical protein
MLQAKSTAALREIASLCANSENLKKEMQNKGYEVDISSCQATVAILGDKISTKSPQAVQAIFLMSPDKLVSKIGELLDDPNAVFIEIKPDHNFMVLPVNTEQIKILQGFQDVYNLVEWYTNRGTETMQKKVFIQHLGDLVSQDTQKRLTAAIALFSYNSPGDEVNDKIKAWFNRDTKINGIFYKALDGD